MRVAEHQLRNSVSERYVSPRHQKAEYLALQAAGAPTIKDNPKLASAAEESKEEKPKAKSKKKKSDG